MPTRVAYSFLLLGSSMSDAVKEYRKAVTVVKAIGEECSSAYFSEGYVPESLQNRYLKERHELERCKMALL